MKSCKYILLLVPIFGLGQAIHFSTLGTGFNNGSYNPVRALFYDTIDKRLYAGGQFALADGKVVWGAAVWKNNSWDSLRGGFTQFPQAPANQSDGNTVIWKIIRFQNKIYFVGGIVWVNGKNQYHMGVWNGTNWDYPIAEPPNGDILDMKVYNGFLYACGTFTRFGNTVCNYVAKFDGVSWQPVGDFSKFNLSGHVPAQMNTVAVYNNEIYVGGAFDDTSGIPRNIAKFDGVNWVNVGSGIKQGGIAWVQSLENFNNKLYIAGYFNRTPEIPGESFVAWNGSSFEDVKSDILSGTFRNMMSRNGKLFVLAAFYDNGTKAGIKIISPEKQCLINGLQSTFTNTLNYSIDCLEKISDSLVVGGLFKYLDTIPANNIGVITNYDAGSICTLTGIMENNYDEILKIFPIPSEGNFTLIWKGNNGFYELSVMDITGRVVYERNIQKSEGNEVPVDLGGLHKGIYYVKVDGQNYSRAVRIIIQ